MHIAVLAALLAIASTSAAAREFQWAGDTHAPKGNIRVDPDAESEWVELTKQKTYTIFVNPATIRKKGKNLEMLHLYELQYIDVVAEKQFKSAKALVEYNCIKEQTRTLSATAYSGNMGQADPNQLNVRVTPANLNPLNPDIKAGRGGVVNRISEPGQWKPVRSGSTEEILLKFVCAK